MIPHTPLRFTPVCSSLLDFIPHQEEEPPVGGATYWNRKISVETLRGDRSKTFVAQEKESTVNAKPFFAFLTQRIDLSSVCVCVSSPRRCVGREPNTQQQFHILYPHRRQHEGLLETSSG